MIYNLFSEFMYCVYDRNVQILGAWRLLRNSKEGGTFWRFTCKFSIKWYSCVNNTILCKIMNSLAFSWMICLYLGQFIYISRTFSEWNESKDVKFFLKKAIFSQRHFFEIYCETNFHNPNWINCYIFNQNKISIWLNQKTFSFWDMNAFNFTNFIDSRI